MSRLRLDLGYDGAAFSGWAAQPGRRTVEGELSAALTTVLRAGEPIGLTVAGRTDAGVHALGQVAHADVPADLLAALGARARPGPGNQTSDEPAHDTDSSPPGTGTSRPETGSRTPNSDFSTLRPDRTGRPDTDALAARLRGILPADIAIHAVTLAPEGFDARFSALSRRYRYRIGDNAARWDPLRRSDTVRIPGRLDVKAMTAAARNLLGLNDFAAFCKRREGATTVRTLLAYDWERDRDGTVVARVVADAFCHSMVRALVGALVPVGQGRASADFPAEVLRAAVRDPRVKVMPAHGLCLMEVTYPGDAGLAARAAQARSRRDHR